MNRYAIVRLVFALIAVSFALIGGGVSSRSGSANEPAPLDAPDFTAEEVVRVSDLFGNPCGSGDGLVAMANVQVGNAPVEALGGDVPAARVLEDPYPSFNGVAIDPQNDLVMLSDTNRKSVLVYDRQSHSKQGEETQPLRHVIGPKTLLGFVAGVAFDPEQQEIYAVNNDIEDTMMVFSYADSGNAKPKRILAIPHGAWGISLSHKRLEFSLSIQDGSNNAIVTYLMGADRFDPPMRVLQGRQTGLADPHGIFVDDTHGEMIVTNWGSWNVTLGRYTTTSRAKTEMPGGSFREPSISIYPETAAGDIKPRRVIQGPDTKLAWPSGIDVDTAQDQIVVANNGDDSILFFKRTDAGNVAPARVIKGNQTGINRPMSVAVDNKNNELWVANFGDHTAVVFDLNARGNIKPKRILRNAPKGTPNSGFGNPITIAYDSRRDELLVPN
jgi:DNA-binding beta-propeller fold protein YncE